MQTDTQIQTDKPIDLSEVSIDDLNDYNAELKTRTAVIKYSNYIFKCMLDKVPFKDWIPVNDWFDQNIKNVKVK